MPLCDVFLRHDLLSMLCLSCDDDAKLLCDISMINKFCRRYLESPEAGKHWSSMACTSVGDDTIHMIRPGLPGINHTKYAAILNMCPWLSKPDTIMIRYVGHNQSYASNVNNRIYKRGMKWQVHCSNGAGIENCIVVEAFVDNVRRWFTVPLRPHEMYGFIQQEYSEMPSNDPSMEPEFKPDDAATAQFRAAKVLRSCEGNSTVLYSRLHDSVDVISQHDEDGTGSIMFVNSSSKRFIRRVSADVECTPPVLIRPAELWIRHPQYNHIRYYGPRTTAALCVDDVAPRIWQARVCVEQGLSEDALKIMEERGADPNNTRFNRGMTLLMLAASSCEDRDIDIETSVVPLLDAGGHIDAVDDFNNSPISHAIGAHRPELVELLLTRGAGILPGVINIAVQETAGYKYKADRIKIANMILDRATDINEVFRGRTPLMFAGMCGCQEMVRELIRRGADPMFRNNDGRTASEEFRFWTHTMHMPNSVKRSIQQMLDKVTNAKCREKRCVNYEKNIFLFLPYKTIF